MKSTGDQRRGIEGATALVKGIVQPMTSLRAVIVAEQAGVSAVAPLYPVLQAHRRAELRHIGAGAPGSARLNHESIRVSPGQSRLYITHVACIDGESFRAKPEP